MSHNEIVNGRIEKVQLGFEDHGFLTLMIGLEHESGYQGYGTYTFGSSSKPATNPFGLEVIRQFLNLLEISFLNEAVGKYVRVHRVDGMIEKLSNILDSKKVFSMREISLEYEKYNSKSKPRNDPTHGDR